LVKRLGVIRKILLVAIVIGATLFSALLITITNLSIKNKEVNTNVQPSAAWELNNGQLDVKYNQYDEFTINCPTALLYFSGCVAAGYTFFGKTVRLVTDLDMSTLPSGTPTFDPIGATIDGNKNLTNVVPFGGIFDGDGHIIYNLKLTNISSSSYGRGIYLGLFAALGCKDTEYKNHDGSTGTTYRGETRDCRVKNLKIQNYTISSYTSSPYIYIGGIAGATYANAAYYVHSKGQHDNNKQFWTFKYPVTIENCVIADLKVVANQSDTVRVGGLVGVAYTNCNSTTSVNTLTQKLTLQNCIVEDIVIDKKTTSLASVLSPALPVFNAFHEADTTAEKVYYYNMKNCITNSSYTTMYASSSCDQSVNENSCHVSYCDDIKELDGNYETCEDVSGVSNNYAYAAYVISYESIDSDMSSSKPWYMTQNYEYAYLKTFLQEVSFSSNNTNMGKVYVNDVEYSQFVNDDVSYSSGFTRNGKILLPKGEPVVTDGNKLTIWNHGNGLEFKAKVSHSTYGFVKWSGSGTSYVAEFEDLVFDLIFEYNSSVNLYIYWQADANGNRNFQQCWSNVSLYFWKGEAKPIVFTSYSGHSNQYQKVEIWFNGVYVEYSLPASSPYYIKSCTIAGTEYKSNTSVSHSSDVTMKVNLELKTYSPSFN